MPPEAIVTPDQIDARADIYALGCTAYFLVTGTAPFSGHSAVEVCAHHLHSVPPPPSERQPVALDLERVILACLAKNPADRPQSAEDLSRVLELCRDAGDWSEGDAEAWWAETTSSEPAPSAMAPVSGELPRGTFCCVDLGERVDRSEKTA